MQVDPVKLMLKPLGTNHRKLKCDILLSTFAFKFNLRRYTEALVASMDALYQPNPPVPAAAGSADAADSAAGADASAAPPSQRLDRAGMTAAYFAHAEAVMAAWWTLADRIMLHYADGFVSVPGRGAAANRHSLRSFPVYLKWRSTVRKFATLSK